MYEGLSNAKPQNTQEPIPDPFASSLSTKLSNIIEEQQSVIFSIQKKIHMIMDRRQPEKDENMECGIPVQDFASDLYNKSDRLAQHNVRLYDILQHLNKII